MNTHTHLGGALRRGEKPGLWKQAELPFDQSQSTFYHLCDLE